MFTSLLRRRHRKSVTLVALGCWLFAVFVSTAAACELVRGSASGQHVAVAAMHEQMQDNTAPPGCEQFCANDLPIPAKVKSDQTPVGEQAVLPVPVLGTAIVSGAGFVTPRTERPHLLQGIAIYTRFLRLAL